MFYIHAFIHSFIHACILTYVSTYMPAPTNIHPRCESHAYVALLGIKHTRLAACHERPRMHSGLVLQADILPPRAFQDAELHGLPRPNILPKGSKRHCILTLRTKP